MVLFMYVFVSELMLLVSQVQCCVLLLTWVEAMPLIDVQVLDPSDRKSLPELTAWYERCYENSKAVQAVWKGSLTLCEESVLDVKVCLCLADWALLQGPHTFLDSELSVLMFGLVGCHC